VLQSSHCVAVESLTIDSLTPDALNESSAVRVNTSSAERVNESRLEYCVHCVNASSPVRVYALSAMSVNESSAVRVNTLSAERVNESRLEYCVHCVKISSPVRVYILSAMSVNASNAERESTNLVKSPQTEEIGLQIITTATISTSFHGKPPVNTSSAERVIESSAEHSVNISNPSECIASRRC